MALLALDGVSKTFGEVVVANDITFELGEGESLGIVGPNGAGKTSLFGIISGDLKPEKGSITLDGVGLLAHVAVESRARGHRADISSAPTFRALDGLRERGSGRPTRRPTAPTRRVRRGVFCARGNRIGASEQPTGGVPRPHASKTPRALRAHCPPRPRVLLLDEIAGGLTDPEVNELTGVVSALQRQGIAVIWIEHVVRALVSTVPRLICLANGAVVADGPAPGRPGLGRRSLGVPRRPVHCDG